MNELTNKIIEDFIIKVDYMIYGESTLTLCFMTLKNDYVVVGQSAKIDPLDFDVETGEMLAYGDAFGKCWELMGFNLKTQNNKIDL